MQRFITVKHHDYFKQTEIIFLVGNGFIGFNNLGVLWHDDVIFQLQHTNFVMPFFLLFFAFMYKVAADAVEENNLTI